MKMMTISKLRAYGREFLKPTGIENYFLDVDVLLMHVLEIDKNTLLTDLRHPISENDARKFIRLIHDRGNNAPIQYLTGKCEFMSLDFIVNKDVLIPRPDTETLVETILENETSGNITGFEIGVGCGCISVSLEYYAEYITMYGADISKDAVWIANENWVRLLQTLSTIRGAKKENYIDKLFKNTKFRVSNLFDNVPRGTLFDFVVSNPPYIETKEIERLDKCIKDFEPRIALDGGADGLDFYRQITEQAGKYLADGGRIYFEIGYNQADAVERILNDSGFSDIDIVQDLAGKDRVIWARRA